LTAQRLVGSSTPRMRSAPPISRPTGTNLGTMKERFPIDRRPAWRQRFLAIARELEAGPPRRNPVEALHATRRPLLAARSLRGIRLGCPRAS